jgi:hypothetical protein
MSTKPIYKNMLSRFNWSTIFVFSWIGILIPPIIYFYFVYSYSLNLPFADDFAQLSDVMQTIQDQSFSQKFFQIFALHNEHRVAFTRLAYLLCYFTFQEINFQYVIIIGNLALLALLYLFFKISKVSSPSLLYFVPISILLYQLQSWKSMTWAASALSNQYILLFTGLTFYYLYKNTRLSFYNSCFFAIISVFTQGSGLATIFLAWLTLLIRRRYKQFLIWTAGAFILGFYYFQNFQTAKNYLDRFQSLSEIKNISVYFLAFLGSSLSLNNINIAVGLGGILSLYLCFLTWDKYFKRNLTVYVFLVYIFFHAALVAIARSGLEVDNVFAPRYKIVSVTLIILVYLTLVERFSPATKKFKNFVVIGFFVAILSYLLSFDHGKLNLETRNKSLKWMANQWVNTNHGFFYTSGSPGANDVNPNSILLRALDNKFYKLPYEFLYIPEQGFSPFVSLPKGCRFDKHNIFSIKFSIIPIGPKKKPYLVRLEGMIHSPMDNKEENKPNIYLILKSRKSNYIIKTHQQKYLKGSVFFNENLKNAGFIALIPFKKIEDGLYRIGFCFNDSVHFGDKFLSKK